MKLQLRWMAMLFVAALQFSFAQEKKVSGTVTDDSGIPLPGATVLVKGETKGTQTDFDGNYSIDVRKGKTLIFSYVGMKTVEKIVESSSTINVVLKVDAQELEGVVVVAYGTADKKSLTGSVATVKGEDLNKAQTTDVAKALEGSVSGVSITNSSGQPGANSTIRIRGIGSLNASSSPLIIVDGSPYDGALNSINNNDVESVSVLKDASSAALYGARGANGVIIITTKKGKKGVLKINLDSKIGINSRGVPEYDIIRSQGEYYETSWESLYNQAIYAEGKTPVEAQKYASDNLYDHLGYNIYNVPNNLIVEPSTGKLNPKASIKYEDVENFSDWAGALFAPQLRHEYNLSMSKGSDKNSYYFSAGYLGDQGYNQNTYFDRYSSRFSYDGELMPWMKVTTTSMFSYTQFNKSSSGNNYDNPFAFTRNIPNIFPIYMHDSDGKLIYDNKGNKIYDFGDKVSGVNEGRGYGAKTNPLATQNEDLDMNEIYYLNQSAKFEVDLYKDLKFTFLGNGYGQFGEYNEFTSPIGGAGKTYNGIARKYRINTFAVNLIQTLKYDKKIGDYNVETLLGHETFNRKTSYLEGEKSNFVDPKNTEFNNAAKISTLDSYSRKYALEGYFGQLNLNYDEKYYLSGSLRRDGSSIFHPDNRWGTFWSVGASWRLERENFMQSAAFVDLLKLKVSYGIQGNDYLYLPNTNPRRRSYTPYMTLYTITSDGKNPGLKAAYKGRKEVTWEENANLNVGLEVGLFKNRLNVDVDYFQRQTNNMLFNLPVPSSTGFSTEPWNIGNMMNKGIEFSVEVVPVKTNDVTWSISANGLHYKNEVLNLPEKFKKDGITRGSQRITEGGSIYDFYMVKWGGVNPDNGNSQYWIENPTTKEFELKQADDYDANSRQNLGSALPMLAGGFGTNLKAYGFDFNTQFSYQLGGLMLDSEYGKLMSPGHSSDTNNWHVDIRNRWTPNNKNTDIPRLEKGNQNLSQSSSRFLTDASFVALRNVSIGYNFPESYLKAVKIKSLRYFVSADNVFILSKRKGLDPRVSISGFNDEATYSPIRTVSMGLSLTL